MGLLVEEVLPEQTSIIPRVCKRKFPYYRRCKIHFDGGFLLTFETELNMIKKSFFLDKVSRY